MSNNNIVKSSLELEVERLRKENEELKAKNAPKLGFKVTEKGAISVYGLGRFPVTLYLSQWVALFDRIPALQEFIKANMSKLTVK